MEPLCRVACSKSSSGLPSSGPRSRWWVNWYTKATLGAEVGLDTVEAVVSVAAVAALSGLWWAGVSEGSMA
jgi:hypothetical protein